MFNARDGVGISNRHENVDHVSNPSGGLLITETSGEVNLT